jgi:hypothetical protein
MAHSALHFSFGMAVGSVFTIPPLVKAWFGKARLSPHFARWFIVSYAAGVYATMPGILRRLGLPDATCDAWWMNVFLLYPWINEIKPGAETMGPLLLGACLGGQYLLLLVALTWQLRRNQKKI